MRYKERKKYRLLLLASIVVSFFLGRCSATGCSESSDREEQKQDAVAVVAEKQNKESENKKVIPKKDTIAKKTPEVTKYDTVAAESKKAVEVLARIPDAKWNNFLEIDDSDVAQPVKTYFEGRRSEVFNDSNSVHLEAAEVVGIAPITDMSSAWNISKPLKLVASCENYYLEELTHSFPFLVPEAHRLLNDIGEQFNKRLWERSKSKYRIKVTSVLRTPATIRDLMKKNRNAVATSAHQYGTTFDISYSKFIQDQREKPCSFANLADLLSEVLQDLQEQGRCYVKYESKQSCFHITVRPLKK